MRARMGSPSALARSSLATTSAGFAWTLGKADNHVTLDEELAHLRSISGAGGVPVNADLDAALLPWAKKLAVAPP